MRFKNFKVLLVAGLVMLCAGVVSVSAFSLGKFEKARITGDAVTIATEKLSDGKAHFYKLEDSGKEIAFFAVKAADGSYKTAFDACDACYKAKKGYEQRATR